MRKFWMLYANGKNSPIIMHHTLADASKEAERLAEKLQCRVYLLEARSYCVKQTITWIGLES